MPVLQVMLVKGGGEEKLSRLLALHSIFHRQLIVFFSFFVSFAFLFHFGFAFVLFCCYCKQNQHKLKTIINMSGLSDLRSSGKVGGRSKGERGMECVRVGTMV